MSQFYQIGGLQVEISGDESLNILAQLQGFGNFVSDTLGATEVHIQLDTISTLDKATLKQVRSSLIDEAYHLFSVNERYLHFELRHAADLVEVVYERGSKTVCVSPCLDGEMLRFALWTAYSMVAQDYGVFAIHASCIVYQGEALLFLGESGTGKSTHSDLWVNTYEGVSLLNDDSPFLRVTGNRTQVYGSPWSGKRSYYRAESYPVKGIVRLVQHPQNKIQHLNTLHAIAAIYPSLPPLFAVDKILASRLMQMTSSIISTTSIFRLECRADQEAVRVNHHVHYPCEKIKE